jgi:exonuclease III
MAYSNNTLKIAAWNIDGIFSRIDNIRTSKLELDPVQNILQRLDIFCLCETHCAASDNLHLEGFHIVQNHRPRSTNSPHAFGGLAVGIRSNLLKGIKFLPISNSEFMWFKLNKLFFGLPEDLYICIVYVSPLTSAYSQRRDDIFTLIESDISKLSSSGNILIMGDFNARTSLEPDFIINDTSKYLNMPTSYVADTPLVRKNVDNKAVDVYGKHLLDMCKASGLRILNGRKLGDLFGNYTCFNHRGNPSVIDYMLCDIALFPNIDYFYVHDLVPFSIHCMISCVLKTGWCNFNTNFSTDDMKLHDLPPHCNWSSYNAQLWKWALSQDNVKSLIHNFVINLCSSDISADSCLDNFYKTLNQIRATAGLKIKSVRVRKSNYNSSKKWYDKDCKTLYCKIKSLTRSIKRNPYDMSLVHAYRKLRKSYKKLLNYKKSIFRQSIFQKLDDLQSHDPQAFWKIYNELCISKSKTTNPISPKKWWTHFLNLMNRNIPHQELDFENSVNNFVNNLDDNTIRTLDFDITVLEVIDAANHLKRGKSAGIDGVRTEMIKDGISLLAPSLVQLFNIILHSGTFPNAWRLSSLTPIHKKGDKAVPKNYRGIAVSSNLCKLFCLVLYNRLNNFVVSNSCIPPNQIGFKKGSRTSDHVLVLKSLVDKYLNKAGKSYLYVCFIDFSAAFDTVWRNALIYKLTKIGIGGKFLATICNMYKSVSFAVKCDDKITDSFETTVGVKQGCVLSPIFFNIFLSDLPSVFDSTCDPVKLNNTDLSCLMYADDLILLSESSIGLQCALDKLYQYCMKWKLLVNIDKSNVMIFNKSGRVLKNFKFNYGDVSLQLTDEYCYLGIIFVPSGSFSKALERLKDKASKAYFKIRDNLFNSTFSCSMKLFDSLIKPILCYGCEVWAPFMLKNLNDQNFLSLCDKLSGEALHIKVCKLVLGVHKKATNNAVRGELGSYPILIFMLYLSIKYWWSLNMQCLHGNNSLVVQALLDNRTLCNSSSRIFSWSTGIKSILNLTDNSNIWDKPNILNASCISRLILCNLHDKYDNYWMHHINNFQPKLRSYCIFKQNFSPENYVIMCRRSLRANFSRLRISAHSLKIERGRYLRIPLENRICSLCDAKEVEDESHFMIRCSFYSDFRTKMFSDISEALSINLDTMSDLDMFHLLMSVSDFDCITPVLTFINSAFDKRKPFDT